MAQNKLTQAVARPARTAVQFVPAAAVTEFVDAFFFHMSDKQYTALFAILTLLIGYLQVLIENAKGIALFRKVPEQPAPIVDEAGA